MSYETVRSVYRLWSSDDSTETFLAIGLVVVMLAPAVLRLWRNRGLHERA